MEHVASRHDEALVITAEINGIDVKRIFWAKKKNIKRIWVYSSTSVDAIFIDALLAMGSRWISPWSDFLGKANYSLGLPVGFAEGWKALRKEVTFIVVDAPNSYNLILRRQGYYWQIMITEASTIMQACETCQNYSPQIGHTPTELLLIPSWWPFAQ